MPRIRPISQLLTVALLALTLAGAGALLGGALHRPAQAFNPQPDPPGRAFGLVSLPRAHTLRLFAVNVALGGPDTRPGDCTVRLGFVDLDGNAAGHAADFQLAPGVGRFLDLDAGAIIGPEYFVRPVVEVSGPNGNCNVVATAEAFDTETRNPALYFSPEPHL